MNISRKMYGRSSRARFFSAAVLSTPAIAAAMMLSGQASAASLYWDTNGSAPGASSGTSADGTWDASTPNWTSDANGSSATSAWVGGNVATFSAGSNATGTSNVTVTGTQSAAGITFEDGTVNLNGGEIDLTGTATLNTASSNNASVNTINSVIGGSAGLTRTAGSAGNVITAPSSTSNLVLGGANTYTGVTQINSGVLTLTNGSALGAAGLVGSGNDVVFGTTANNTDAGADALSLARLDLSGGITVTGEGVTLRSGGYFDKPGQLSSASGVNTWSNGEILIDGGANNAAGDGLASIGAAAGATLIVDGGTIHNNAGLVAGTNSGNAGVWWAKDGAGTVILRNVANTSIGTMRVLNGTLVVESDGALGQTATDPSSINQCVILNAGGSNHSTVAFEAPPNSSGFNYTQSRGIYTAGTFGFNNQGEIANLGGNNSFNGEVVLSIGAGIGVQAGSLELAGPLFAAGSAPRNETKLGPGELIISSTNDGTAGSGTGGLTQIGITSGVFNIAAGQLTFRNNPTTGGTGSLSGGIGFSLSPGTTLSLDNSLGVNSQRIGASAPITLASAELRLVGNATQSVSQSAGNVQASGYSTITVSQPASTNGSTTTFDLSTATFNNGATVLLRGINGTTGFINLNGSLIGGNGAAGSKNISILPQAVGDASSTGTGTDFVTIDSGHARALTAAEYAPLTSGANSLDNTTANTGGTVALSANTSVNSLKISGGTSVSIAAGDTFSLNSGALLGVGTGTSNITGGTINFVNPGFVTVPTGSSMTLGSAISASTSGLTKSGGGVFTLAGDNSAFNGPITINSGLLAFSADNNLGSGGAHININGGTLGATATLSSSRGISLQSPIFNAIDVSGGNTLTLNGTIDGNGALTKTGDGNLILTAGNGYVGQNGDGTIIQAGMLTISGDQNVNGLQLDPGSSFYSNEVALSGGVLHLTAGGTYRTPLAFNSDTGGLLIDPGLVATFGDPNDIASDGRFLGSGTLILDGGGTLNPVANNLETGDNIIKGGSTLEFTLHQGISNLSTYHAAHYLLDNGRLLTIGQSSTDPNLGGITAWSPIRGITIGAGGGTIEAQVGSSPAPYSVNYAQVIAGGAGSGALTITTDSQSIINLSGANTYSGGTIITPGSTVQVTGTGNLGTGLVTNNGTLQAQTTFSAPGGFTGSGSTTIGDGTNPAVVSAGFYRLPSLTVSAGATAQVLPSGGANSSTSKIGTLSLTPTSLVDITDNKLILSQPAGTWNGTAYTGVSGLVQSARGTGTWTGTTGITSSTAASNPNPKLYSIGVVKAGDIKNVPDSATTTFGGQTVLGSDTLVMATYGGDANLDGKINIDDYGLIDSHVGQSGTAFGWHNGDFNYDGKINIDDYGIIDGNIGAQGAPIPTAGLSLAVAQLDGVSAVPEPGSLCMLGLAGVGLLGRRRRRSVNKLQQI